MSLRRICFGLCVVLAVVGGVSAQQVTPRIAGLENNAEYMSLMQEDARLQVQEDSVTLAVNEMRRQFRDDPSKRQQFTKEILELEERIFGIRNARGRLTDRISTIEQEWVLSNLNASGSGGAPTAPVLIPEKEKVRNLVYNRYIMDQLPAADYAALKQAQQQEMSAVEYLNRYWNNYQQIATMAADYAAAQTEPEAVELFGKCKTMLGLNDVLADSLAATWNSIFDDKTYAYGYLLDKLGQDDILAREEQLLARAAQTLSEERGQYASDMIADYFLRKGVVLDYEIQVATLLQLDAARDSLRGAAAQLKQVDYRLPRIQLAERYFIDYAPVAYAAAAKYTTANPIPECKVFQQGTVYRLQLGTFTTKRPVAAFKGIYPLCYQKDEDGKWLYFAGGYATEAEAKEGIKVLKARGFTRPEIVVWRDGVYRNLTRNPETMAVMYRVEIMGVAVLPDAVKEAITASAGGHELSRVGQMFVVGLFGERVEADRLVEALRKADGSLEIKVAEITENTK